MNQIHKNIHRNRHIANRAKDVSNTHSGKRIEKARYGSRQFFNANTIIFFRISDINIVELLRYVVIHIYWLLQAGATKKKSFRIRNFSSLKAKNNGIFINFKIKQFDMTLWTSNLTNFKCIHIQKICSFFGRYIFLTGTGWKRLTHTANGFYNSTRATEKFRWIRKICELFGKDGMLLVSEQASIWFSNYYSDSVCNFKYVECLCRTFSSRHHTCMAFSRCIDPLLQWQHQQYQTLPIRYNYEWSRVHWQTMQNVKKSNRTGRQHRRKKKKQKNTHPVKMDNNQNAARIPISTTRLVHKL